MYTYSVIFAYGGVLRVCSHRPCSTRNKDGTILYYIILYYTILCYTILQYDVI